MFRKLKNLFNPKIHRPRKNLIKVNGKSLFMEGNNNSIMIANGKVFVNGREISKENLKEEKVINVEVFGYIDKLSADCCRDITINGDANDVDTKSGNVYVKGDTNFVSTVSGNVSCRTLNGSINTVSGNVSKKI